VKRPARSSKAAAAAALLCAGCVTGAALRQRALGADADIRTARDQNAQRCAPRDLAVAEANLRFARLALDQGDPFRAEEHLRLAEPAARNAVANSKDCGKVTVLIREKELPPPPPAAPKVALKDTDGDGVPDIDDLCPEVPGPKENHGCPVVVADRDGDGVPDKDDQCPDEPGPADNHGCPRKLKLVVVKKDRIEIRQQIHFKPAKSVILPDSFELLRQVAQVMKDAPQIGVRIEGHTDNVGKLQTNLRVSQARADAVKEFLVKEGVDPKHLTAGGFGPTRPIASNATRAGKTMNRRVEFRIVDAGAQ
jgi:outer membrane protein OmpA-like peptidoglycan-associated protein